MKNTETIEFNGRQIETYGDASISKLGINKISHTCTFFNREALYNMCAILNDSWIKSEPWVMESAKSETSCFYAIVEGRCPATAKRRLEVMLDKSIFFEEKRRVDLSERQPIQNQDAYRRGWDMVGAALSGTKKTEAKQPEPIAPVATQALPSYSDAINQAIQESE